MFKGDLKKSHNELNLISGGIIKEAPKFTDMDGFKEHLEEVMGEALTKDVEMMCELDMIDQENDPFDLYEIE